MAFFRLYHLVYLDYCLHFYIHDVLTDIPLAFFRLYHLLYLDYCLNFNIHDVLTDISFGLLQVISFSLSGLLSSFLYPRRFDRYILWPSSGYIIYSIWIIVCIFISTRFWPIYPLAFFRLYHLLYLDYCLHFYIHDVLTDISFGLLQVLSFSLSGLLSEFLYPRHFDRYILWPSSGYIIYSIWINVCIFISTTFWQIYPLAFFRLYHLVYLDYCLHFYIHDVLTDISFGLLQVISFTSIWIIVCIFISTTFWPIYPLAFFRLYHIVYLD